MKIDCEVIRDILPLYADDACSEKSRQMVDEHLEECSACREQLERTYEVYKKNQYGAYLKDILDGKYIDFKVNKEESE